MRSICARSSSRRSSCSKRRIWSRSGPGGGASGSRGCGPPGSERRPSARRMRWTSTPSTPEPSPRRPKAAIASRARSRSAASSPSRSAWRTRSRSSSRSRCSPPWSRVRPARRPAAVLAMPCGSRRLRRRGRRSGRTRGRRRAGRRATSRAWRPAPRGTPAPSTAPRRARERVEQLRGPDREPLGAQRLREVDDPRREPVTSPARELDADALRHDVEVRAVLDDDDIVERKISGEMSSAPSSSSARAQSIDSAIDGGFLKSSSRTFAMISMSLRRPARAARACAGGRSRARARARGSRATGRGSGASAPRSARACCSRSAAPPDACAPRCGRARGS